MSAHRTNTRTIHGRKHLLHAEIDGDKESASWMIKELVKQGYYVCTELTAWNRCKIFTNADKLGVAR